jgi:hypothetical protein
MYLLYCIYRKYKFHIQKVISDSRNTKCKHYVVPDPVFAGGAPTGRR